MLIVHILRNNLSISIKIDKLNKLNKDNKDNKDNKIE